MTPFLSKCESTFSPVIYSILQPGHAMSAKPRACHSCWRSRLKCDRSLPHCLKCTSKGQSCLGYGILLRWENGRSGVTSDNLNKIQRGDPTSTLQAAWGPIVSANQPPFASSKPNSPRSLIDPLAQDPDHRSRRYLNYCRLPSPAWLLFILTFLTESCKRCL